MAIRWLGIEGRTNLNSRLVRTATGSIAVKVGATALLFLVSLLLARLLGVKGFGTYVYAMAWANFLSIPALLGLENLLIRELAAFQAQSAWGLMRGLLKWANRVALFSSLGLASAAAAIVWGLTDRLESGLTHTLWVAMATLPILTLFRLRQSALHGLQHVVKAQLAEIFQMLFLIALIIGMYFLIGDGINATLVVIAYGCALCIIFLIWSGLLSQRVPQAVKQAIPVYRTQAWVRSMLPLVLISSMHIINTRTDVIMLGAIKGPEAAGIYNVASRGALLITFVMMAVNSALAPTVASLYTIRDLVRLQRIITISVRITTLLALPIGIFFMFFGYWYLLLFGKGFTGGQLPLTILSAGQLFNVAMGSVGLLLTMTGHEREAAMGLGIGAVTNVILNAALIPYWGAEGAAVATVTSVILWNVLLVIIVYRKVGIHATALGRIGQRGAV